MTTEGPVPPRRHLPFPVVLDLSDDQAYSVLTLALSDYAERARHQALDEADSEIPNNYQIAHFNKIADVADGLVDDVERQLDDAGKAPS